MKRVIYVLILIISTFMLSTTINAWSEYTIGQEVEYNGINFYVIKNSGTKEDSVTMLKAEPLTVEEVNTYGAGHINRYTNYSQGAAINQNGYGGMQYYSSSTCGGNETGTFIDGCTTDYEDSEIKYVVDAWKIDQAPLASEARLLLVDDITALGYEKLDNGSAAYWLKTESTPSWIYNNNYWYWMGSSYEDSTIKVWSVLNSGDIRSYEVLSYYGGYSVRPVIIISKSILGDIDDSKSDDKEIIPDKQEDNRKEISTKVMVANTYMKTPIIIILLGFISACTSIVIYYIIKKKKGV